MTKKGKPLDLHSKGIKALIQLTNGQFGYWQSALMRETTEVIKAGNVMDYWFIMSELALHENFQLNKKTTFKSVPNLEPETVRKHVAGAQRMGFVQTVKTKEVVYLQLTPAGQRAIADTLERWIEMFGSIQKEYFS